jgi:signal transduction histidine kinase
VVSTSGRSPDAVRDYVLRTLLAVVVVGGTIVTWRTDQVLYPGLAAPVFGLVSVFVVAAIFRWDRLPSAVQVGLMAAYAVLGGLLLPLTSSLTTATLIPFFASSTAGGKLASRRAAIGVAVSGAVVATVATWVVEHIHPASGQPPFWVPLAVCLPVYVGISHRARADALRSAQQAAEQARRARESEAREAALEERGRIAREVHDVLGHSLSGIALQLDMADALRESGRDEEATTAVRRARALAVESISETRRAVHALSEDTLPLPEALRRLAGQHGVELTVTGEPEPIGAQATHTLVRAAQEALTNAAKHAPGADRDLRLVFGPHRTTLTVVNGPARAGSEPGVSGGLGMGLPGMRERAAVLGGSLRAGPSPSGDGWTVELEIPT